MIKDKLMVGNLILVETAQSKSYYSTITETSIDGYKYTTDYKKWGVPVRNMGISLTPEILEKCGFESIPHFTVMDSRILDVGRGRKLSIGCVGTPNEMLFLTDEEDGKIDNIIVLHNWDYDGPLYLHKLQNIISLLKPELTITL